MKFKSDIYYINKVLKGDVRKYAFLVEKHKDMAFTSAFRIVKNSEDAEEIAQDAFIKAFKKLDSFKGDAKFTTWLYRIIYTTAISFIRKKRLNSFSIDDPVFKEIPDEDSFTEKEELSRKKELIRQSIDKLPDDDGFIVTLYYMSETPIGEISEITGLSQANVKVKLFRARKKLFELLKKHTDEIYM